MAVSEKHLLQVIARVAEALSQCERRRLLYLCESLDSDVGVACVKETLKSKVASSEVGQLFLAELLLQMRRYDILKKVFGCSRAEVETTLAYRQVLPKYRVLMANVSEDMSKDDLDKVKFLLSSILSRERLDKAQSFLEVITELEKLDKVSSDQVDFVEDCLRSIGRVDLANKISSYKTKGQAAENVPVPVHWEQNRPMPIDCYKFNTEPRGVCVIIDCVGNDGEMLEHTFRTLHFNVFLHKWLNVDDSLSTLREIFRNRQNHEGDGFVCCIISRGTTHHLLATDAFSTSLHLDTVRRLFTAEACPMLAGKPKLFFIQRYSVPEFQPHVREYHRDEDLETDGLSRRDYVPTDADVFWSHCWTDECQLERRDHHSIYLKALTDTLHRSQRRKTHLVDAHIEVNAAIYDHNMMNPSAKYNIDVKHTLRKDLYLH